MPGPSDSTQKKGRTWTVHISKQGVEDDIRISEWKSNSMMDKTAWEMSHFLLINKPNQGEENGQGM
jgi:hypothetical protein